MNRSKVKQIAVTASLFSALALIFLLLIPMMMTSKEVSNSLSDRLASESVTQSTVISGTYQGTVAITVPAQLGALDLTFDLAEHGNVLSGMVDDEYALVHDDSSALHGTVDTSHMTPTFTLTSDPFSSTVSGRQVERSFTLEGQAAQDGELLYGLYTEVITGFTPEPMMIEGWFMATRPSKAPQDTTLLTLSTNTTLIPTGYGQAVATATVLDQNGQPVSGVAVTFSSTLGSMSPATVTTNANGRAISTFTADDMPGLARITAECCDGVSQSVTFEVETATPSNLALQIADTSLNSGEQTLVTATVRDQFNNLMSGTLVTFQGTLGSVSPSSGVTDNNGQASTTFTAGNSAGQAAITALAGTATDSDNISITLLSSPTPIATNTPIATATSTHTRTPIPSATAPATNTPVATVTPSQLSISDVRTSNVRNGSFTVSWLTNGATTGEVRYGTNANNLNQTANDTRGAATSDVTHYVSVSGLQANTTYYFDVVSGVTDNNGGAHYSVTTGATLGVPGSDTAYGQVFKADGSTPAVGSIVYITLKDANQAGSSAEAAPLSALVDNSGFWFTNLADARLANNSNYFSYSASGDQLDLEAQGGVNENGCQTVDTSADTPASAVQLDSTSCTSSMAIALETGWNNMALPLELSSSMTAESACTQLNEQGGNVVEIDRWDMGGWSGHICGLPFNDFDLEMGTGYFIKTNGTSNWTIEGSTVSTPPVLALQNGWNSISLPHTDGYTAESLCQEIISQGVTAVEIDRWHMGGWSGHICGLPFNDFDIERGEGYFVKTTSSGTVTPGTPTSSRQQPATSEVSPDELPAGKAMPIRDLRISNLRDTSVTLSWTTEEATTGYVRFGKSARRQNQVAYDARRAQSTTHYVVLDQLTPETTYHLEIISGAEGDETTQTTITTAPSLENLPEWDTIYGQVFQADGATPATDALVYLQLKKRNGTREAMLLSAPVDEQGYWHANLGNARLADGSDTFAYEETRDLVLLTVQSGTDHTVSQSHDTADLHPAAPIILELEEKGGLQLYLPLINN